MLTDYLAIAAGGAIGALARYLVALALPPPAPASIPWATLAVNVVGSLLLGYYSRANTLGRRQMLFAAVGCLGSFTTFSTLGFEIVQRCNDGRVGLAATYAIVTLVFGSMAAWTGAEIASRRRVTGGEG